MKLKVLLFITLVSSTVLADYTHLIRKEAIKHGLDPELAVAIAKVESNLNPNARGKFGEVGLFQIRPEFAQTAVFTPESNIREGIRQLIYWRQNCPVKEFFICFNQGSRKPKYPKLHPYYKKVQAALVQR